MKEEQKQKRRVFSKINLLETSIVGIPAYPDAHMSLIKQLSKITNHALSLESNTREVKKMPEEQVQNEQSSDETVAEGSSTASETTETTETAEPEKTEETEPTTEPEKVEGEEKSEEEKAEEEKAEEVEEKEDTEDLKSVIKEAFMDAVKQLNVERGLNKSEEEIEDKSLSAGELAVKYNLFRPQ